MTDPALGAVLDDDRGSLPFQLIHGEALVACAAWALSEAGVTAVDPRTSWSAIARAGEPFVLHDPLCPMTPASFISECVSRALGADRVVVAYRPVTDTVKVVDDGFLGDTVDRAGLRVVVSPIVLPPSVVGALTALPTTDFEGLAESLREAYAVELVEAPAAARRVGSLDDLRVLEALTRPA